MVKIEAKNVSASRSRVNVSSTTAKQIIAIIEKFSKVGEPLTTRELSNLYHEVPKDSKELPTEVQDSLLTQVFNHLPKSKILSGFYRGNKIWMSANHFKKVKDTFEFIKPKATS